MLSKPNPKYKYRYFTPKFGKATYLDCEIKQGNVKSEDNNLVLYITGNIPDIDEGDVSYKLTLHDKPYKVKTYDDGELIEVEKEPSDIELDLYNEFYKFKDKSITGIYSIKKTSIEVDIKESFNKSGNKTYNNPESFKANTLAVLEARYSFYLTEMNKALEVLEIDYKLDSLSDLLKLNEITKDDSLKAKRLSSFSDLIKSFF